MCPHRSTALRGGRGSPLCSVWSAIGGLSARGQLEGCGCTPNPSLTLCSSCSSLSWKGWSGAPAQGAQGLDVGLGGPDSSAVPKCGVARWSQNYAWSLSGFSLSGPLPFLGVPVCTTPHPCPCPSTASTETPGPWPSRSLARGLCRAVDGLRI